MTIMALTPPPIDADGFACVEGEHDGRLWQFMHSGIRIAAWPHPHGGAIVNFIGGTFPAKNFEDDAALCRLSPDLLDATIAALVNVRTRTAPLTVVYGPMASGKTFHAPQIRQLFDAVLVEDLPLTGMRPLDLPAGRVVLLSNEPVTTIGARLPGAQLLSIAVVKQMLAAAGFAVSGEHA